MMNSRYCSSSPSAGCTAQIRLWLDDERLPPDPSWLWVQSVWLAKLVLEHHNVVEISLDSDLGSCTSCQTYFTEGRAMVMWMLERSLLPPRVNVHTRNEVSGTYMYDTLRRYAPEGTVVTKEEWGRSVEAQHDRVDVGPTVRV